jgi:hypothetical protein
MKREKRLTKKERKAQAPSQARAAGGGHEHQGHIHCIACGKHLDAAMFGEADGAEFIRCEHGSDFPSCIGCHDKSKAMIAEHDRTNKPVQKAAAWH